MLLTIGKIFVGMSFFGKYSLTLVVENQLVFLIDTAVQAQQECKNQYMISFVTLLSARKTLIPPFCQMMFQVVGDAMYAPTNSIIEATPAFDRNNAVLASPAIVTLVEKNNDTSHQPEQAHVHPRQLCTDCQLQSDDITTSSLHKTGL